MIEDRKSSLVLEVMGQIAWLTDRLNDDRGLIDGDENRDAVGSDSVLSNGEFRGDEREARRTDNDFLGDCTCCNRAANSLAGSSDSSR